MSEPSITVTLEPLKALGLVSYLRLAPSSQGGAETGYVNLGALIKNTGTAALLVTKVEVSVPNSSTPAKSWTMTLPGPPSQPLAHNASMWWTQNEDYLFAIPSGPLSVALKIWTNTATDPKVVQSSLFEHTNPTPEQSYRFWGAVRDLRPGEFWQLHGTAHGQALPQLFAYDVGVSVENGDGHNGLLPNTEGNANEHFRIWGKPIYAIADGTVTHFRNDYPTNPRPLKNQEKYEVAFPDLAELQAATGDGNGNFFTITTGDETVLYAHMQPGSLNPKFLTKGAAVKAGDFLGLAGNAGASSSPHLHIHANKTIANDPKSWDNVPRPMVMRGARVLAWPFVNGNPSASPWVTLNKRGIPPTDCAVWPADSPVVKLRYAAVRHMGISDSGQLWIVRTDNGIRTTNDRFPLPGIYLDVLPGGSAKEIALVKEQPFVIGMNDRLWEGRADGWVQIAGSPLLRRISVNSSNGIIWAITVTNDIIAFNPANGAWMPDPVGGKGKDICALGGQTYVIGNDDHIWQGGGPSGWGRIPGEGKGKRIAIDRKTGTIWVIGMDDGIWAHNGSGGWNEHPWNGVGKDLQIFNGTPYIIGSDDGVWQRAGAIGWQHINVVEAT